MKLKLTIEPGKYDADDDVAAALADAQTRLATVIKGYVRIKPQPKNGKLLIISEDHTPRPAAPGIEQEDV